MRRSMIGLMALALLAPGPALADRNAANACAAGLGSDARLIYERALPGAAGGGDLPTVVKDAATALVKAGQVARASARGAAQAAGACLKQL
ncbi:hypothetical protein ACUN0C_05560 [Faunimonas sp. B44]|uniref:hypothetical protein n=1 Tax=Faunimonas sp. B44 TaxID=3461493 RepID=UPI0040443320